MFLYGIAFCVLLNNFIPSYSQETSSRVFNRSVSSSLVLNPVDVDYPESNLWLISSDDPIPGKLTGQWSIHDAISKGQIVNVDISNRESRIPNVLLNVDNSKRVSVPLQLPLSVRSQGRVADYISTATVENQRRSSDSSGTIARQNPSAVLVQLPLEVTDGVWVRPQQPFPESVAERQNSYNENGNDRNTEAGNRDGNSDIPTVFLPIRELISRLPNSDPSPQSESNVQLGQYYNTPFPISSGVNEQSGNAPSARSGQTDYDRQQILILRQTENFPSASETPAEYQISDHLPYNSNVAHREYENVLTAEDVELLERLGVLSSIVIDPRNATMDISHRDNSREEYEIKPATINNHGQYVINPERGNGVNFSDVVLIDIPQFTAAKYHENIAENAGINRNPVRSSPYILFQSDNATNTNKSGENVNTPFSENIDAQLLEILQYLNNEEFLNFSSSTSSQAKPDLESGSGNKNSSISAYFIPFTGSALRTTSANSTGKESEKDRSAASTMNVPSSSKSGNDSASVAYSGQPSVSSGRIQPRLLENPVVKDNEILERGLVEKVAPMSERKLEILKKLYNQPQPYFFGFRQDDGNGTLQHRNETADAKGVVKGSYGYRDAWGVYRNVSYIADKEGFHAMVKTNEPGTVSHSTADAVFMSETPPIAALLKMMAFARPRLPSNFTNKP